MPAEKIASPVLAWLRMETAKTCNAGHSPFAFSVAARIYLGQSLALGQILSLHAGAEDALRYHPDDTYARAVAEKMGELIEQEPPHQGPDKSGSPTFAPWDDLPFRTCEVCGEAWPCRTERYQTGKRLQRAIARSRASSASQATE